MTALRPRDRNSQSLEWSDPTQFFSTAAFSRQQLPVKRSSRLFPAGLTIRREPGRPRCSVMKRRGPRWLLELPTTIRCAVAVDCASRQEVLELTTSECKAEPGMRIIKFRQYASCQLESKKAQACYWRTGISQCSRISRFPSHFTARRTEAKHMAMW